MVFIVLNYFISLDRFDKYSAVAHSAVAKELQIDQFRKVF